MSTTTGPVGPAPLSSQEQAALGQAMQRADGPEKRRHKRLPLDERFALLMRVEQGGNGQYVSVTARDLSSSGIGFFHVAYLHPGTPVSFIMKNRKGEVVSSKGTVLRCRHVSGRLHEVGAVFEQEIQVEVFVTAPKEKKADPGDVYAQIAAIAEQLKTLAADRAATDTILDRIGKLALLVSPPKPAKGAPPKEAGKDKGGTTPKADAGGS